VSVTKDVVTLQALYAAWREARRKKKPSNDQVGFETFWIDNLQQLLERVIAGTWQPDPPTCFVAKQPKAREIHAPTFSDRVIHHWLVPQLEWIYEPTFIFDSFSNRRGKGTHAAIDRLQAFVRQVHSGQSKGENHADRLPEVLDVPLRMRMGVQELAAHRAEDAREAQGTAVIKAQREKIAELEQQIAGANATIAHFMGPDGERHAERFTRQVERIAELEQALDPRRWTQEQHAAWHRNIPDVQAAFAALRSLMVSVPK
jgi:hypothetical protein